MHNSRPEKFCLSKVPQEGDSRHFFMSYPRASFSGEHNITLRTVPISRHHPNHTCIFARLLDPERFQVDVISLSWVPVA